MTRFQLRTTPEQTIDQAADFLLDTFEDRQASTIQYEPDFLKGLAPTQVARDLFRLGCAVYCADKLARRDETADFWTRDIQLQVPVSDVDIWRTAGELVDEALTFLAGEPWSVEFVEDTAMTQLAEATPQPDEAACLFSGGLDSLTGAIDLLEGGKRLVLVGHHDSALTDNRQVALHQHLRARYGADRVSLRRLLLGPATPSAAQAWPLPAEDHENTTRARSFLFITAGVAIADALGPEVPLHVPENGFIGINVPLTGARAGSLSTRTTHPLYMSKMAALLNELGLAHGVVNPYRLKTKGEALEDCADQGLLTQLAPESISCAHPEAARWRERDQGNCGYCYPCLIRRASMHRISQDRSADYSWDVLTDPAFLRRDRKSGASLRALLASLGHPERPNDVLRNGRIPGGEAGDFYDVYRRGRAELRTWLTAGAAPHLHSRLGMS